MLSDVRIQEIIEQRGHCTTFDELAMAHEIQEFRSHMKPCESCGRPRCSPWHDYRGQGMWAVAGGHPFMEVQPAPSEVPIIFTWTQIEKTVSALVASANADTTEERLKFAEMAKKALFPKE